LPRPGGRGKKNNSSEKKKKKEEKKRDINSATYGRRGGSQAAPKGSGGQNLGLALRPERYELWGRKKGKSPHFVHVTEGGARRDPKNDFATPVRKLLKT